MDRLRQYSAQEEAFNIMSHAIGLVFSLLALLLLIMRADRYGDVWHIVSVCIFGSSLVALYAASTIYHGAKDPTLRARLRILDHASIYILIAGTYTPYSLITLIDSVGWIIFGISWAMAITGIVLKLFFTGKYNLISTLMYVFMGWIIVFAITPLINSLSSDGMFWLIAGGVAYTAGAVLYSFKKIKFNHAIFHLFVLLGSFCHFVSIYYYVLPGAEG